MPNLHLPAWTSLHQFTCHYLTLLLVIQCQLLFGFSLFSLNCHSVIFGAVRQDASSIICHSLIQKAEQLFAILHFFSLEFTVVHHNFPSLGGLRLLEHIVFFELIFFFVLSSSVSSFSYLSSLLSFSVLEMVSALWLTVFTVSFLISQKWQNVVVNTSVCQWVESVETISSESSFNLHVFLEPIYFTPSNFIIVIKSRNTPETNGLITSGRFLSVSKDRVVPNGEK